VIRKILSYLLGALFFFLLVAARPWQGNHYLSNAPQEEQVETSGGEESHGNEESHGAEKFSPGEFIFDHIGDSYEWHILTYKDFHLTIPLPVIVYSRTKGLNIFLFSKFHHGHAEYRGFRYELSGENRGKVIEIMEDGSTILPVLDLSFTKDCLAILVSLIFILWLFLKAAKGYRERPGTAPTGVQNLVEPFIIFVRDEIAIPSIGHKKYERYLPYLLTIFFFIWINNIIGLIPIFPGGANVTGNITVTMVLALFTFTITSINGNKNYWKHIINPPGIPWWLKFPLPLIPIIEIVGMLIKPIVLMIRLFANITAGHIIALGFFSLIFIFGEMSVGIGIAVSPLTIAFTIFMTMIELLVALIQAFVFTLLSSLYFGMATEEHH
jgi:F-type H+-transporting ATPase subunit a